MGESTKVPDIQSFVSKIGVTYPLGYDRTGAAARQYHVSGIPSSFLFGPKGNLIKMFVGYTEEVELEKIIREAISKK